jgi:hypothetical protein
MSWLLGLLIVLAMAPTVAIVGLGLWILVDCIRRRHAGCRGEEEMPSPDRRRLEKLQRKLWAEHHARERRRSFKVVQGRD